MKKSTCPEEVDFCVNKRPKSEIRQYLIKLNEIGPNPSLSEEEEPKQHQLPEEVEPKSQQSQEVILITQPEVTARRFPKVPTVEVIRGQQSAQTHHLPEETVTQGPSRSGGHPRLDSNSFFGDNFAQEARRRKRGVFRDACPPGQPQQLPDAHRRQQWRPSPTKSSFTAFTLASSKRGATTHGYQASISYLLTNSSTTYIHTSAYTV